MHPDVDRLEAMTFSTRVTESLLGSQRFQRFLTWKSLVRVVSALIEKAKSIAQTDVNKRDKDTQAVAVIKNAFKKEDQCLDRGEQIPKHSSLRKFLSISGQSRATES